jgi:hypothetical protein
MTRCRFCSAEIEWVTTSAGRPMPIDPRPAAIDDLNANVLVRRGPDGRLHARVVAVGSEGGRWLDENRAYPHHATCPNYPRNPA